MDRPLLERMVGAVAILLLLIVVAPAVLDGVDDRREAGLSGQMGLQPRTEIIYLQTAPQVAAQTRSDAVSAAESGAGASAAAPAVPASQELPVALSPLPPPSPARQSSSPPSGFAVQVGSFSTAARGRQFAGQLNADGYNAFVQTSASGGNQLYRVFSGPEASREAAEKLATRLRSGGYSVMVVELEGAGAQ